MSTKHSCTDGKYSLAEFAALAANKAKIIFGRGMYVAKNTAQSASVKFVRKLRTNYARSRLQKKLVEKSEGIFPPA